MSIAKNIISFSSTGVTMTISLMAGTDETSQKRSSDAEKEELFRLAIGLQNRNPPYGIQFRGTVQFGADATGGVDHMLSELAQLRKDGWLMACDRKTNRG